MAMVRAAGLRTALRGGSRSAAPPKRSFSSSAGHNDAQLAACTMMKGHDFQVLTKRIRRGSSSLTFGAAGACEADKWEKITYLGIAACTILTFVNLSKPHPHYEPPPPYPYLHIRNKEFPWGPDGLFERKHDH